MFQSTLPHGERRSNATDILMSIYVSIHAPTRGATLSGLRFERFKLFQSTLPHGERPYAYNTYDYKACMMLFLRKIYFVCHIPKKHIAILIKDSKSIHAKEE